MARTTGVVAVTVTSLRLWLTVSLMRIKGN